MAGPILDPALTFQLNNHKKWLHSLGTTWWAVLKTVQLGHDLPWPEHLKGSEKELSGDLKNVSFGPEEEEIDGTTIEELQPEDTEVDDYLVEFVLQSRMEEDCESWEDEIGGL